MHTAYRMPRRLLVYGVCLSMLSSGCAYIDQNLRVNPQLIVLQSDVGRGKEVALRVVDDREDPLIGKRGYPVYGSAKISTDQDLAEVLRSVFVDGMRRKGFQPVGGNDSDISLKVELRSLAYDTSMGIWTGGNIGKAAVKVVALQPSGRTYENTYRSQKEIRTVFIGSQETNTTVINDALNDVLNQIFADTELWNFLTQ